MHNVIYGQETLKKSWKREHIKEFFLSVKEYQEQIKGEVDVALFEHDKALKGA